MVVGDEHDLVGIAVDLEGALPVAAGRAVVRPASVAILQRHADLAERFVAAGVVVDLVLVLHGVGGDGWEERGKDDDRQEHTNVVTDSRISFRIEGYT